MKKKDKDCMDIAKRVAEKATGEKFVPKKKADPGDPLENSPERPSWENKKRKNEQAP